ncbi:cyclic AMP-dependent transcription factor ATF-4 [Cynocephalus volans]|uniref:cyclic AMP-dependent transcription factor ATF-4 n=1 Tax=Cynocephalus volans TaxID=110931 RepID=UPI002FC96A4F
MTELSFLSSKVLEGDLMSPFDQSGLGAEESLGLLDDYLEVAEHFKPHGFSGDKAKAGSSEWLAVDGLVNASDNSKEDAFSGTDWMLEKVDLKELEFGTLLDVDDLETMPDELLATFYDACDDLFAPPVQESNKEPPQTANPIGHLPERLTKTDQVAPFTFLQPFPLSSGVLSSTPDHSFSLELGSISEGDGKPDSTAYITMIPQCVKEEDTPSDNDSGICMSPESYLGSPQHSPSTSRASPNRSLPSPGVLCGSTRPKPYDPPGEKMVAAKVKGEKLDKKLKKMEQNKTAATRYRQKKRAEQEALTGECKELEKKNEALKERADSLAKEIQYLKDLIEEVRKARGKKRVP